MEKCVPVSGEESIHDARAALRQMMEEAGVVREVIQAQLLTIVDELGRNILRHGGRGMICIAMVEVAGHRGFRLTAEDRGEGFADLELAFKPGYSQDMGMGMGLNLLKALSDDLRIASLLTGGARIEAWKWI
ncbi:MAG: hypothetical protein DSZ23_05815 [Thermodesulfatator sp.]|nr:MAG: hypothetical protein DSZ23_05815 [Thermodesulfatator sp.]